MPIVDPSRRYSGSFSWDATAARYRDSRGRFVSWASVERELTRALDRAAADVRAVSESLRLGNVSLARWQIELTGAIKTSHAISGALAAGGFPRLSAEATARIEEAIRRELGYLQRFAEGIGDGSVRLDGRFLRRADMYALAGRETYFAVRDEVARAQGYDEYRNVRNARDSCAGCLSAEARGWVPIGSLPPIGTRDCLRNCLCTFEYRRSSDGDRIEG